MNNNIIRISVAVVVALLGIGVYRKFLSNDPFTPNQIDNSKPPAVITVSEALARANAIDSGVSGIGTQLQLIYDTFRGNLGPNDYALMHGQYGIRGGDDLTAALAGDLSNGEYDWVRWLVGKQSNGNLNLDIIDGHANGIRDAVEGAGTDEEKIFQILSPYHVLDLDQLSNLYSARYNENLTDRLRSELSTALYRMLERKFPGRF